MRLVATDLDGTLLRADGTVSPRTAAALVELEKAGVVVVFVTGRPLRWARDVFAHVASHGVAIVSNGALVWDVAGDAPLETRSVAPELGIAACERLRAAVPGSVFAVENLDGIALEDDFLERHPVPDGARRGDLAAIFDAPALKVLARHEVLEPRDFWARAEQAIGDDLEITWSSSTALLEMSAAGVTKASTLAAWAESHGIGAEQVVAFGDMPNDLAMLRWAGTSYAMENAAPDVRAAATHVAPHHDDDGVAQVLEQLLR